MVRYYIGDFFKNTSNDTEFAFLVIRDCIFKIHLFIYFFYEGELTGDECVTSKSLKKNPPKQLCCQAVLQPATTGLNYFILYTVIKSILILHSVGKKGKGNNQCGL